MYSIEGFDLDAFINFAVDPRNTQDVFKLQEAMVKSPLRSKQIEGAIKACTESASFMELYEKKYIPRFPTIEELQKCPKDSLGQALAKHLIDNGINLDFAGIDVSVFYNRDWNPFSYLGLRGLRNHDVYHVVAGLGISPLDEFCVLNLQVAQFCSPLHATLIGAGYLHTVFQDPSNLEYSLAKMNRYFQIGKKARFLPGFPFEDHWHTNLREVRSMLNIDEASLGSSYISPTC